MDSEYLLRLYSTERPRVPLSVVSVIVFSEHMFEYPRLGLANPISVQRISSQTERAKPEEPSPGSVLRKVES